MRKFFNYALTGLFLVWAGGCATLDQITQPTAQVDNNAGSLPMPPYSGPKARIAVAAFDVKAAKASGEVGSGLREMLVTALVNSNRFRVVERQVLDSVMQEQELAASGAAQPGGVQRGQIKTADIIVTAAVTEFEPQASGGAAGIGGGGGVGSGVLGALLGGSMNKAHMALDLRVIDTSTSEVLAATRVQGQASDVSGGLMAGFFGGWALGGGLTMYANTPMEKAIRICIIEAVRYVSQTIPADYYKY
ncbi:MAG TPA: CsgG/HfaB family protein [Candidatus Omnitrophota bacterium]|nr:CsgG/HfaB family protein [Candidatus Omnitrophota bacterium]HQJ15572.1 CsgG/HfaB family protein [Candidatus Omnitrophota bacterium]